MAESMELTIDDLKRAMQMNRTAPECAWIIGNEMLALLDMPADADQLLGYRIIHDQEHPWRVEFVVT